MSKPHSRKKTLLALTCSALVLLPAASGFANSTNGPTITGTVAAGEQVISDLSSVYNNVGSFSDEALGAISVDAGVADQLGIDGATLVARGQQIRSALNSTQGQALLESGSSLVTTAQTLSNLSAGDVQAYVQAVAVNEGAGILSNIAPETTAAVMEAWNGNPQQLAQLGAEFAGINPELANTAISLYQNPANAVPLVANMVGLDPSLAGGVANLVTNFSPENAATFVAGLAGVDPGVTGAVLSAVNDPVGFATDLVLNAGSDVAGQLLSSLSGGGGALAAIGGGALEAALAGDPAAAAAAVGAAVEQFGAEALGGTFANLSGGAAAALEGALAGTPAGAAIEAAGGVEGIAAAAGLGGGGAGGAGCCIPGHTALHQATRDHFWNPLTPGVDSELERTEYWMVETWFKEHWLPMLMMMTEQLNVAMEMQTNMMGQFLDAKHQLETQRLFQQLQAQAHKDYHPSEGMCTIGTNIRSLASSERYSDLSAQAISNRTMQRQLLSGSVLTKQGAGSDAQSRLGQFKTTYCNPADNNEGLELLCGAGAEEPGRRNKDVDYTRTMETVMTLDMDFTEEEGADLTADEEDIFALASNLYASEPLPYLKDSWLSNEEVVNRNTGDSMYIDYRSIAAKRSVALNSFSNIAGMKTSGAPEVQPFLYAVVQELGLPNEELVEWLGERPSYFAQMEVLTKKLYQDPNFYTNLYDKPVNVERKSAALQAISLMQDRDIYRSLLRSEALLSVLLEMRLIEEQERVNSEIGSAVQGTSEEQE